MMIDKSQLRLHRLGKDTQLDSFKCAYDDLNEFLRDEAKAYQAELMSVTYLLYYGTDIVAFFSLLNDSVNMSGYDNSTRNRINRKIPL